MQTALKKRVPRGFELALACTALVWAIAAAAIAQRSAHGLAGRFHLFSAEVLLATLFLIFLLVFGFQLLDWIATRRGDLEAALPLPKRLGWTREWGVGAAVGWGAALAVVLPLLVSGNLHGRFGTTWRHAGQLALAAVTLIAVALAEELVFRGYPFNRLIAATGPSWAAVLTSFGFAATIVWATPPMRLVPGLCNEAILGLLLAVAYLRTQALWVGWGLHFAYRAIFLLVFGLPAAGHGSYVSVMDSFASGPRWLTGSGYGLDAAWLTAPLLLGALMVLLRCTRDYAWRYTYTPAAGAGYAVDVAPPAAHIAMEGKASPAPLVQILSTTSTSPTVPPPPTPSFPQKT